ncbi:hypothetical protein PBI_SCTP2_178 [Salicola phage SCTP-2]|nr:hypothetical protein PBI_SCTP2_178 [Salicola phage SCTP-2]
MKEILKDVIRHTHELGDFEAFKLVVNNEGVAQVKTSSKDFTVTLNGVIKHDITNSIPPDSESGKTLIGFSRLNVLAGYLKSPVFNDEGSSLELGYMDNGTPRELVFKTDKGHYCTYRMMQPEIARRRIKTFTPTVTLNDDDYDIVFTPDESFLKQFQSFSSILGKESNTFSLSIEDHTLYMNLGEDDTAKIPVVNDTELESMAGNNFWPVKQVLAILKQAPDLDQVTMHVSNENGLININVETDQVSYSYKLTAA